MDRTDGSPWFYSYLPRGVARGATSALMPLFAYALGGTLFTVGIIAAAASLASVPAFILWGSLSDRFVRRKVFLLIGFVGSGIALLAMAVSGSMSQFYLANLLAGFLGAASGPAGSPGGSHPRCARSDRAGPISAHPHPAFLQPARLATEGPTASHAADLSRLCIPALRRFHRVLRILPDFPQSFIWPRKPGDL